MFTAPLSNRRREMNNAINKTFTLCYKLHNNNEKMLCYRPNGIEKSFLLRNMKTANFLHKRFSKPPDYE